MNCFSISSLICYEYSGSKYFWLQQLQKTIGKLSRKKQRTIKAIHAVYSPTLLSEYPQSHQIIIILFHYFFCFKTQGISDNFL